MNRTTGRAAYRAARDILVRHRDGYKPASLREAVGAGEPLNPEVIDHVQRHWGVTIRDGFGQTETTALIGNTPGSPIKPGSMGLPVPGVGVEIVDPVSGQPASEGEICLRLDPRPVNLMAGYGGDDDCNDLVSAGGYYHTGTSAWPRGGPPIGLRPTRFSPTPTETLRPINASGASNSWNYLRPSPARSGVSSCALVKTLASQTI